MIYRFLFLLALLAALPVLAQPVDETAKRDHFFPLVVDGGGFQSALFLTNVSDAANQCTLDLQGPGLDTGIFQIIQAFGPASPGETIELAEADASLTLFSTGQQALTFGYATLECAGPVVASMVMSLSEFGPPIASTTLESSQVAREFQFPVLPRLGSLGLIFSNDTSSDASCAVELEDSEGASVGGASVAVPMQSTAVQFLDELIQLPDGFDGGTVRATCTEEIAALGLPFSSPAFTALRAVIPTGDDAAKPRHVLPLIVDGDGFQSHILITNLSAATNQCTMDLHGTGLDTGRFESTAGVTAADSSATLNLAGLGDDLSLVSIGEQSLAFGYATLDCNEPVVARNLLTAGVQGNLAGMATIPGAQAADVFRFPVPPRSASLALILTNDAATDTFCAVVLEGYSGFRETRGPVSVPSQSTTVRFLGEIFEFLDFFPGGWATVSCAGNVTAISLPRDGAVFAAMPPAVLSFSEMDSTAPFFPYGSGPGDQTFIVNELAYGFELPDAIGGNGTLSYSLEPSVPGMNLDDATRMFFGAPSMVGEYAMTYTVTDEDGASDTIEFTITVEPDTAPSLAGVSPPEGLRFMVGEAIEPVLLPEADGGNSPIFHILYQGELGEGLFAAEFVPGLYFDPFTRQLSGVPTTTGVYNMVYTALDANFDMDSLEFTITVVVPVTSESLINVDECTAGSFIDGQNSSPELSADCQALAGFANALIETGLIPEENVIRQWGKGEQTKLDRWEGIEVSDGRVTSISLEDRDLKGDLPAQLGQLSALTDLRLFDNQLTGRIPPELGELSSLETLYLDSNRLSGAVPPELGQLGALTTLSLGDNELTGTIPLELADLGKLESLSLWGNELTGPIPAELANLSSLQVLNIGINKLSEAIPPELGQLSELIELDLGLNELTQSVPPELGQLVNLERLVLEDNQLSGQIPPELARLSNLQVLNIGYNELSGPIPSEFGELSSLVQLLLSGNQLSGIIPEGLAKLGNLETLDLEFNELTGILPWDFRERIGRGDLELRILGNLISGFEAPPTPTRNPVYSSNPAENGNAAHHSISYFQGPLMLEWDWEGARVEHQTPILGRTAALAVSIDHGVAEPPLVITRVLDAQDEVLAERLAEAAPATTLEIEQGHWRSEYVFDLPGEFYQASNQLVHVIDPDDELAETNEDDNQAEPIVLHGEVAPRFRATFIPIQRPDGEEWYKDLDPELLMLGTRAYLPIADDFDVRIGPALESDSEFAGEIIVQVLELWNMEADPDEFYHAIANENIGGIGFLANQVAVSTLSIHFVTPHEFGHNFGLFHTPGCGAAGPDENYPYPEGRLGPVRGWDPNWRLFVSGENQLYADLMSYCGDFHHISDYHYRLASEYWLSFGSETSASRAVSPPDSTGEGYSQTSQSQDGSTAVSPDGSTTVSSQSVTVADDASSVALSGRVTAGGAWSLSQAQMSTRGPRPPADDGEYTLILFDNAGVQLYAEPLSIISLSEGDDSLWAARTPIPLRTAAELVIQDAQGIEVLRELLPALN